MSLRYGDKTRVGEASSKAGRNDPTILNVYEQEFLAPGTWTWPGKCAAVDVLLVGGGGGGAGHRPSPTLGGYAGGGGGVAVMSMPVTAPIPVTVGAGGTGGATPGVNGNDGGTSIFGSPSSPTSLQVGGGRGGSISTQATGLPFVGGSGSRADVSAGRFGTISGNISGSGGAGGSILYGIGADRLGYGAGNATVRGTFGAGGYRAASRANTGKGGCGGAVASEAGFAGGSGIVIVRWFE